MKKLLAKCTFIALAIASLAGCSDSTDKPKKAEPTLSTNKFILMEETGNRNSLSRRDYRRERLVKYGSSLGCLYTEVGEKTWFSGEACFDKNDAPPKFAEAVFEEKAQPGMLTDRKETFVEKDDYFGNIVMVNYSSLGLTCLRHGSQLDKCWDKQKAPRIEKGNLASK